MTAKLTPRVGDRVLVAPGFDYRCSVSQCGVVMGFDEHGEPLVRLDLWVSEYVMVPFPHLTVVDRSPVEWPEGWGAHLGYDVVRYFGKTRATAITLSRGDIEHLLATGPNMLARWDELMGNS